MEKKPINGIMMYVDDVVKDFTLHQKTSTNVEFFGSAADNRVFVQFKTGRSYIYENVPHQLIADMEKADSIGSFIAQLIVKPNSYPTTKFPDRLVKYESNVVNGDQYNEVDQW
jgi:hypothetical protein